MRAVSSVVERLSYKQVVGGSNPSPRTGERMTRIRCPCSAVWPAQHLGKMQVASSNLAWGFVVSKWGGT
jgi:hypothetical protein